MTGSGWTRSIINHLYWCASSIPDGNGDLHRSKFEFCGEPHQEQNAWHGCLFPKSFHAKMNDKGRQDSNPTSQSQPWGVSWSLSLMPQVILMVTKQEATGYGSHTLLLHSDVKRLPLKANTSPLCVPSIRHKRRQPKVHVPQLQLLNSWRMIKPSVTCIHTNR